MANVFVKEYQKQNLVHYHLNSVPDEPSKSAFMDSENINILISAEIAAYIDSHLREKLFKHMDYLLRVVNPSVVYRSL